jgi:phosphoribosyl-ATP pyrophosphohydrolase
MLDDMLKLQQELMEVVPHEISDDKARLLMAVRGLIEESLEYSNACGVKPWRPIPLPEHERLEELTDIWFYLIEIVELSGFTFDQIYNEYKRKWRINIERYQKGKAGDYSWDDRTKGL